MSLVRRNPKRDKVERALIDYMKVQGMVVWQISQANFPDLICLFRNMYVPVEIKDPKGKLSYGQKVFMKGAANSDAPAYIVTSEADVDRMLNELTKRWERP